MRIRIQDLLTLTSYADGGHFIIKSVSGLGKADIRTSSFLFSGRPGGLITDQLEGFRNISIVAEIGANDMTFIQHELDRKALDDALPIGETIPIYFTTFAGTEYRIDANVTDSKMEYKQGGRRSDVLIQLTAGDPLFYSTDGGDEQTATISRVVEGGYITPYILPVVWEAGGSPTDVINSGNANYYPVITLHNAALNPVITNRATGESFKVNVGMQNGDTVIIDMYNRTITLNGSDILGNKDDESIWWALLPGSNPLVLSSDTALDPVTATITWRNGVTSI